MKVLVDSDVVEEHFLNRENDMSRFVKAFCRIITQNPELEVCITRRCLNKICDSEHMELEEAEGLASKIVNRFTICSGSPQILHDARQHDSKIEPALELECGLKWKVDAIITQEPKKYGENTLPLWSVDELSIRLSLDSIISRRSYEPQEQLSLPWSEPDTSKYMVRNTISIILKALNILKTVGFQGLTKNDLSSNLQLSGETIQSIIWDLYNFGMAYCSGSRVIISQHLLDTGSEDISKYLSIALKENLIVQQIYAEIESRQCINRWGLDKIIKAHAHENGMHNKILKDKTLGDYRCRIISWLLFAKLLEKRSNGSNDFFVIPQNEGIHKFNAPSEVQQLNLFELHLSES